MKFTESEKLHQEALEHIVGVSTARLVHIRQ